MTKENNRQYGQSSEIKAREYLRENKYKILEINYRTKIGEIDIIAKDRECICFIEVKSRSSLLFGHPKEALDKNKQHKISQCAIIYLKTKNLINSKSRFDVLSILDEGSGRCELIKDAFSLDERYAF